MDNLFSSGPTEQFSTSNSRQYPSRRRQQQMPQVQFPPPGVEQRNYTFPENQRRAYINYNNFTPPPPPFVNKQARMMSYSARNVHPMDMPPSYHHVSLSTPIVNGINVAGRDDGKQPMSGLKQTLGTNKVYTIFDLFVEIKYL